jgi:hypothetical protein
MTSQRNVVSKRLDRGEPTGNLEIVVEYAVTLPLDGVARSVAPGCYSRVGEAGVF